MGDDEICFLLFPVSPRLNLPIFSYVLVSISYLSNLTDAFNAGINQYSTSKPT